MQASKLLTLIVGLSLLSVGAAADSAAIQADAFMTLLKEHRFEEAANAFYYPSDFTPQRLTREKAMGAQLLKSLFDVAGDLGDQARSLPPGTTTWWTFGFAETDRPMGPSDVGADASEAVFYQGHCSKEGRALVLLNVIHLQGRWQVLSFEFRLPRSADESSTHFEEFTRKVWAGCKLCQPRQET